MSSTVDLSAGFGEVLAPQTLVGAFLVDPRGRVSLEPGLLHGRSTLEQQLSLVKDKPASAAIYAIVWVAVELDGAGLPVRFKGAAVSEVLVDEERKTGFKSLAEQVNRMADAMTGRTKLDRVGAKARARIKEQLLSFGEPVWDRSPDAFKRALDA